MSAVKFTDSTQYNIWDAIVFFFFFFYKINNIHNFYCTYWKDISKEPTGYEEWTSSKERLYFCAFLLLFPLVVGPFLYHMYTHTVCTYRQWMFERIRKSHHLKTLNVCNVEFFLGLLALAPHAMTSSPRLIVACAQAYIGECAINLTNEFACQLLQFYGQPNILLKTLPRHQITTELTHKLYKTHNGHCQ